MRLISQHGNVDIPYETSHILYNIDSVIARINDKEYTLGKYSDKSKALKVMEMLRNAYTGKNCGYHTEHGVCYHSKNDFKTKVFYFPKDEDVEV